VGVGGKFRKMMHGSSTSGAEVEEVVVVAAVVGGTFGKMMHGSSTSGAEVEEVVVVAAVVSSSLVPAQ
jgi:3-oxoacyl-(acyl-carrier-protein) synthase